MSARGRFLQNVVGRFVSNETVSLDAEWDQEAYGLLIERIRARGSLEMPDGDPAIDGGRIGPQ